MIEIGSLNSDGTVTNIKTMKQSELTSECWMIQMFGIEKCDNCDVLNTDECGGQEIRKRILLEKTG